MNARRHARLAHDLIEACGGLDEAAQACRVGKTRLSDYQNPAASCSMPADVMADLEAYCGRAIYSGALSQARPTAPVCGEVVTETHDVVTAAAALLPLAVAMRDGKPGARAAFQAAVSTLTREVDDVEAIADGNVVRMGAAS